MLRAQGIIPPESRVDGKRPARRPAPTDEAGPSNTKRSRHDESCADHVDVKMEALQDMDELLVRYSA